jgi:N-hydroxyarylamine O-acetyltransferase
MISSDFIHQYLKKIGFQDLPQVDFKTLKRIHQLHVSTFPFENLTPLSGETVSLEMEQLQHKFLDNMRGGYCFEQNSVLKNVLETIGFNVTPLMGRVILENRVPGRTHMVLIVEVEAKKFLVDVGFGGLGAPQPIELIINQEQETTLESYRIIKEKNDIYTLQIYSKGEWKAMYQFDFVPYYQGDFEVGNWFTSKHPNSSFTKQLMVTRIESDKRLTLNNTTFSIYHKDGEIERNQLTNLPDLLYTLQTYFNIHIHPTETAILTALETIIKNDNE